MPIDISRIKHASLKQHDSTDCGAACLASIIRYFGGSASIEKIRRLSGTSQAGTTMLGLYQAAQECGMKAVGYEAAISDLKAYKGILILHITRGNKYEHYVVCHGFSDQRFVIWDPAIGLIYLNAEELEEMWLSHKCLSVSPGNEFNYAKAERKDKRRWICQTIKPDKDLIIASVCIGMIIAILGAVMAVFTQKLLDKILPYGDISILITSALLVFSLLCVRVILNSIRQYMLLSQGRNYNIRIVDSFFKSLLQLPKPFLDSRKTGDMVARLNDTMRIQRVISDIVSAYIIDILIVIIMLVMIFRYSAASGYVSIAAAPLIFLMVYRWNRLIITSQYDLMSGYAMNESNFISSFKGITEIKSMNWQKIYSDRNHAVFSSFQEKAFNLGRIKIKLGMLTNLAGTCYLIGLIIYTSFKVIESELTQGELMAILSLSSTLLPSVMNIAIVTIPLNEALVAIERMFEFTQLKPENDKETGVNKYLRIKKLTLEGISFRYPGQRRLFSEISLAIEKGQIVALIGDSGSGKSTLVNILMRFYIPESGCINVNGVVGANELSVTQWRKSVGLVPQDVHIFNGTVLENIIPDADESKIDRLMRMIANFGLDGFINNLPLGLATITGEEGVKLSGGQKQIISFIRALYNEPDILLIDEGTSGMDRDTEKVMINILSRLKNNVGILLVTHRINLVRQLCDKIFILEGGRISASGIHDELILEDNIYARFWNDLRN